MTHGVSVVIPCYRCGATISRALDSVAAQTRPADELILVDDASGDDTADLLRGAARRMPGKASVNVICLAHNGGPATARNAGWAAATGRYVAFLDSDDSWHPRKLELQGRFLDERPDVAMVGDAHQWLRAGATGVPDLVPGFDDVPRLSILLRNRFAPSSVMIRRDVARRFREGQRRMEDHLLWMQLACDGARLVRLRAALSYRHAAPFGQSGLSADMRAMAREETANFFRLAEEGLIAGASAWALAAWATGKYIRRRILAALRGSERGGT